MIYSAAANDHAPFKIGAYLLFELVQGIIMKLNTRK